MRGRRVLVTRPAEEPPTLDDLLRELGAEPVRLPCIAFAPPTDRSPLKALPPRLGPGPRPDCGASAPAHAADRFVLELRDAGLDPAAALAGTSILAAGDSTARKLRSLGLSARAPPEAVGAEAMVASFGGEVRGKEVLVPRAEEGNP